jgi:hypothetical protein
MVVLHCGAAGFLRETNRVGYTINGLSTTYEGELDIDSAPYCSGAPIQDHCLAGFHSHGWRNNLPKAFSQ